MSRIAIIILVVFLMGLSVRTGHTKELTLDDCIEKALQNRATIIAARGDVTRAAAGKRSALGAFLPRVSASYSYSKGKETNIDPPNSQIVAGDTVFTAIEHEGQTYYFVDFIPTEYEYFNEQDKGPNKNWSIDGRMSIFDLRNWFDLAAAKASHAGSKLDVLESEQDLIYAVKTVYYAYLATVENAAVQEDAVTRAKEQLKLVQSRFDLGSASLSDVLKQKVQYGNDRLGLLRAENAVTNAKADLAYTIGLDPREDYQFSTDYRHREYESTLEEAISFGLEYNPGLLAQGKNVDWTLHRVRAAKASYLPTLSGYAGYSWFNGTQSYPYAMDFSSDSRTYGLSVSWNIFDGFIREQMLTEAKVMRSNARAAYADQHNLTVSRIKTAYLDIEQYKEQKVVSSETVVAAEEDLKITQEKYNLGAATILDLLDAQVSLKQAQVGLIRAELDLNLSIAKLEKAMGKM